MRFRVGNKGPIFLWHDNWHPEDPLYMKFGQLSSVIHNGNCLWSPARSDEMELIQRKVAQGSFYALLLQIGNLAILLFFSFLFFIIF